MIGAAVRLVPLDQSVDLVDSGTQIRPLALVDQQSTDLGQTVGVDTSPVVEHDRNLDPVARIDLPQFFPHTKRR